MEAKSEAKSSILIHVFHKYFDTTTIFYKLKPRIAYIWTNTEIANKGMFSSNMMLTQIQIISILRLIQI